MTESTMTESTKEMTREQAEMFEKAANAVITQYLIQLLDNAFPTPKVMTHDSSVADQLRADIRATIKYERCGSTEHRFDNAQGGLFNLVLSVVPSSYTLKINLPKGADVELVLADLKMLIWMCEIYWRVYAAQNDGLLAKMSDLLKRPIIMTTRVRNDTPFFELVASPEAMCLPAHSISIAPHWT